MWTPIVCGESHYCALNILAQYPFESKMLRLIYEQAVFDAEIYVINRFLHKSTRNGLQ